jgi:hypothetical protein
VAMIAAAMRGDVAETAEAEPAPSPATAEAAATAISQDAALAAPDAAEFPLDDDVVLTVADSAVGQGPDPARAVVVALEREPTIARVEPAPIAENIEPELAAPTVSLGLMVRRREAPSRTMAAPSFETGALHPPQDEGGRSFVDAHALRLEPAALELEPLVPAMPPAAEDNAEAGFAGFELEPLVVAIAAEPPAELHPAAIEEPSDEPVLVAASAIDDVAEEPLVDAPAATSSATEPAPETDAAADDDLPLAQATDAMATGFPDQEPVAAPETATATAIAEPVDAPPPAAAEADPVALQVEHDLDVLTGFVPDDIVPDNTRDVAAAPPVEPVREDLVRDDDPAAFLLDAPLQNVPPAADVGAQVADTEASRAQISDALAAIETELFAGATPPAARAHPPAAMAMSPAAARPTLPPIVDGPLAALMAMSEEERIALFS